MNPETRISRIIKMMGPLKAWMKDLKPNNGRLHIHKADWLFLRDNPDVARLHGFVIDGETVRYDGYELIATNCRSDHSL